VGVDEGGVWHGLGFLFGRPVISSDVEGTPTIDALVDSKIVYYTIFQCVLEEFAGMDSFF
jgi:hypothetical protein